MQREHRLWPYSVYDTKHPSELVGLPDKFVLLLGFRKFGANYSSYGNAADPRHFSFVFPNCSQKFFVYPSRLARPPKATSAEFKVNFTQTHPTAPCKVSTFYLY